MNHQKTKSAFGLLSAYLLVNIVAVGMLMIMANIRPKTNKGWVFILVFGFPVWLIMEWVGSKIFSNKVSDRIDPSNKIISIKRLLYSLIAILTVLGIYMVVVYSYKDFMSNNFMKWY